mmetsp:Transcript_11766/g.21961  ORF Transcript_11766/g.21961 Transcript_11766/m.21961 type:complete len:243 (+) Transcript_11766:70-798(+)
MDNPQEAEDEIILEEKSFGQLNFKSDLDLQLSSTAKSEKQSGPRFQAWDHVQAYKRDQDEWFAAVVIKRNGNGTYAIVWAPPNEKWPAVRNVPDSELRAARKARKHVKDLGQSFAFERKPRLEVNRYEQETPGPGAYNTQTYRSTGADTTKYSMSRCKLGTAWEPPEHTRRSKHQKTPGPGCYRPPARDMGTASQFQFSFPKAREQFRSQDTPGPGCYKPKLTDAKTNINGLSYSMRTILKF